MALLATLLYALTGARDVLWGEPTKLALLLHAFDLDLAQWTHAGSLLLVWPFTHLPFLSFAHRVHLASAVMSGAALGLVHATLLRVGATGRGALCGVAAAALAHTIWMVSAMAENYAPVLLILACAAWLAVARRAPLLSGVVLGFGVVAHPICTFGLPAFALGVHRAGRARGVARLLLGLALGWAAPTLALSRGDPIGEAGWGAVLERYTSPSLALGNAAVLAALGAYNFAGPALVLLFAGLRRLQPGERRLVLLFALVHYAVALFWIPQRAVFIPTPVYLAAAWPIALGAEAVLGSGRIGARALLALLLAVPPVVYAAASVAGRPFAHRIIRDVAYRDESAIFFAPWGAGAHPARTYVEDVGTAVEGNALLLGDFTLLTPLQYAQAVEGWRPDVTLFSVDHRTEAEIGAEIDRALGLGRPVSLLEPSLDQGSDAARARGTLVPVAGAERLHRLEPGAGDG